MTWKIKEIIDMKIFQKIFSFKQTGVVISDVAGSNTWI